MELAQIENGGGNGALRSMARLVLVAGVVIVFGLDQSRTMVLLTDDERTFLKHIAEEPLAPVSPLQTIADELISLQLVTVDLEGRWIVTEAGAKALRDGQPPQ